MRSAISAMLRIGLPVLVVMQIVELADAAEAGFQHFDIELRRDRLDLLRRHRQGEAVHDLAPAPETVVAGPARFGKTRHAALEGMAVQVGHRRNEDGDTLVARRRRLTFRSTRVIAPSIGHDAHIGRPAVRQEGLVGE